MATRAKKPSKATEDEHIALEEAMKELSSQTDALLADTKKVTEKPKKPTLPKKSPKIIPHTKGVSLDIVGHAPSQIKSAKPKNVMPETELLPEHAGLSFNEKDVPPLNDSLGEAKGKAVLEAPVITKHEAKRIDPLEVTTGSSNKSADEFNELPKRLELEKTDNKTSGRSDGEASPSAKPEDDGIVRLEKSEREKPTVLDTNEYHSELHDWSKLSGGHSIQTIVLLVVVSIAAGLVYLYITEQLPNFL